MLGSSNNIMGGGLKASKLEVPGLNFITQGVSSIPPQMLPESWAWHNIVQANHPRRSLQFGSLHVIGLHLHLRFS
jgi:hypothetical protein